LNVPRYAIRIDDEQNCYGSVKFLQDAMFLRLNLVYVYEPSIH